MQTKVIKIDNAGYSPIEATLYLDNNGYFLLSSAVRLSIPGGKILLSFNAIKELYHLTNSTKISSISILAKEWFDKINGNSYFSAEIIVNKDRPDEKIFSLPYQGGYGDAYLHEATTKLRNEHMLPGFIEYANGLNETLKVYCERNGISLLWYKQIGCKKRDLKK